MNNTTSVSVEERKKIIKSRAMNCHNVVNCIIYNKLKKDGDYSSSFLFYVCGNSIIPLTDIALSLPISSSAYA
jgi:hypothetical protein